MKTILQTPRVLLREFVPQDDVELYDLDSDPEVMRFMATDAPTPIDHIRDVVLPRRFEEYVQWPGFGFWAAVHRESSALMGWFHFRPYKGDVTRPEIGYRLKRAYWGQGCATEVSKVLVERAFAMADVVDVVAEAAPDNTASIRVMEKVGMARVDDGNGDKVVYALRREDWGGGA